MKNGIFNVGLIQFIWRKYKISIRYFKISVLDY